MTTTPAPVLLTGGTGTTGRRIASRLRARGLPVRVASRAGSPAFAWEDPGTWDAQLTGARAAYLCFSPDLALPGAAEVVSAFTRRAGDLRVPRVVLLSGRGEPGAQRAEAGVREAAAAAGTGWTVVRSAWFAQVFAESFLADEVRAGVVRLPVGGVREPFVDVEDVADVATAALVEEGYHGQVHEVTGPRALTFGEAVGHVSGATGRPVRWETVPREEHLARLRAAGADEGTVQLLDHLFTDVLDGRNAAPTDGVQRALGRPPRDLTAHLADAVAAGTWTTDAPLPSGVPS